MSMATMRSFTTVNPTTANGLSAGPTTNPAVPLTSAGRARGAKLGARERIWRATACAPVIGGRAPRPSPASMRKTASGSSAESSASKSPERAAATNASTISR
jgi:hypothetical protein